MTLAKWFDGLRGLLQTLRARFHEPALPAEPQLAPLKVWTGKALLPLTRRSRRA